MGKNHSSRNINQILILLSVMLICYSLAAEANFTVSDTWGITYIRHRHYNYMWIISNFSLYNHKEKEYFNSPSFSSSDDDPLSWDLQIYPKGYDSIDYVSLFLNYKSGNLPEVDVKGTLKLLNSTFDTVNILELEKRMDKGTNWGSSQFVERSYVMDSQNEILLDDKLILKAEFTAYLGIRDIFGNCSIRNQSVQDNQISDHFQNFIENEKFSDVVLTVKEETQSDTFPAHKVILAAQSPVFASLLENSLKGKLETIPILKVTDVKINAMKEVLRFLYTGRVQNLDALAEELLTAANKYKIERLKIISETYICKTLNFNNAIDVLLHADQHDVKNLKWKAMYFIAAHASSFIHTAEYEVLKDSRPDLIVDIFNILIDNKLS